MVVNAGELPSPAGPLLQVLGVVAFVGVLVGLRRAGTSSTGHRPTAGGFGRGYWLVVAAEVAAGAVGIALLNGPLDLPQGVLPWVALLLGGRLRGSAQQRR